MAQERSDVGWIQKNSSMRMRPSLDNLVKPLALLVVLQLLLVPKDCNKLAIPTIYILVPLLNAYDRLQPIPPKNTIRIFSSLPWKLCFCILTLEKIGGLLKHRGFLWSLPQESQDTWTKSAAGTLSILKPRFILKMVFCFYRCARTKTCLTLEDTTENSELIFAV
ncbi:hypothetical protein YC2023_044449 [Brassica napus]